MIYEAVDRNAPIRQGDLFFDLPKVEVSLQDLAVIEDDGEHSSTSWRQLLVSGQPVSAVLPLRPVPAIVATQDCDALRAPSITLCEIWTFRLVERKAADTKTPKGWKNHITQQARMNLKWFYLPPSEELGIRQKMAVDFAATLRLPRGELEQCRDLRRGRLNDVAREHFRERIAEFFRRYPYDEWYSLDREELACYMKEYPDTKPFPWQEIPPTPETD